MSEDFTKIIVGGKVTLITILLTFSFVNAHTSYVATQPRKFLLDSLITGIVGGASSVLMSYTRGVPDLAISYGLMGGLFFFFYNVCREFSGYFALLGVEPITSKEKKQYNILKYPVIIISILILLYVIYIASIARVTPDMSFGIFSNLSSSIAFIIELVIVVGLFVAGDTFVGYDHGEKPSRSAIMSAISFTIAHILLQFGGFYNTIFS
jgi:hypothetical protein